MKRILILALTMSLLLSLASMSLAGTAYFDVMTDGEVDRGFYDDDLSQVTIGLEVPGDTYKFAGSFSNGTIEDNGDDWDTTSLLLKGGYALINDRKLRLDLTGGYYYREEDYLGYERSYRSLLIGFDSKLKIDPRASIDFNFSYGLAPDMDSDLYEDDIDSISIWNLKFNYLFTPKFGGSIGYQSETVDLDKSGKDVYSGFTIGAFVKF
ncbi:MAG TPA: hypothetical protein VIM29_08460 [Bacillota bacterium]